MRRLSSEEEERIITAYEAWDPSESSVTELADSLGVTRQTLYAVLNRNGIEPKSRRIRNVLPGGSDSLIDEMAEHALEYLLAEIVRLRNENGRLRRLLEEAERL